MLIYQNKIAISSSSSSCKILILFFISLAKHSFVRIVYRIACRIAR